MIRSAIIVVAAVAIVGCASPSPRPVAVAGPDPCSDNYPPPDPSLPYWKGQHNGFDTRKALWQHCWKRPAFKMPNPLTLLAVAAIGGAADAVATTRLSSTVTLDNGESFRVKHRVYDNSRSRAMRGHSTGSRVTSVDTSVSRIR